MFAALLGIRTELLNSSRLPALSRPDSRITALELTVLVLAGVTAAATTTLVPLRLGVPGHAILKGALPLVLGLALVPRRNSALIMGGVAAIAGASFVSLQTTKLPLGALTSLCLLGPFLELALIRAPQGWRLYLRLMAAGTAANLIAFGIHSAASWFGFAQRAGGNRSMPWPAVAVSFALCGAAAGLISAMVWFRASAKQNQRSSQGSQSP